MTALTCVTAPLVAVFGVLGVAKLLAVPAMRSAAAHAGLPVGAYRAIGAAELAAAVGLVAGHTWPALGVLTAGCLFALLLGALVVHWRNRDPLVRWTPAIVAAGLTVAYAILALGSS